MKQGEYIKKVRAGEIKPAYKEDMDYDRIVGLLHGGMKTFSIAREIGLSNAECVKYRLGKYISILKSQGMSMDDIIEKLGVDEHYIESFENSYNKRHVVK